MRLIVPLLCLLYKYTPVGSEGDSLDKLIIVDGLIIRLKSTQQLNTDQRNREQIEIKEPGNNYLKLCSSIKSFTFGTFFFSFFLSRWILTLAPPAVAPLPQTWWWMTQLGASSPIRCSRRTAKRTEQTARPTRA